MKNITLTLFVIANQFCVAQSEYNYQGSTYMYSSQDYLLYLIPAVKNKTVEITTTRNKRKKVYHYEKTFNEFGKVTEEVKIKEGERILTKQNTFDANGNIIQAKKYKKGRLEEESTITRDEEGRQTAFQNTNGKGKIKSKSAWEYMPNFKCLKSSTLYKKNGTEVKRQWKYEYYGDCEKKQSVLSDGKGKILKTWTYDCKKEGEELTKKKDVNQICKWEETDENFLIRVQQNFDEKGKLVKMVAKYRASDTSLVSYKRYNSKNELTSESTYNPDTKKNLSYTSYKNGKVRYATTYEYDGERVRSYMWEQNGKMQAKSEYIYNDNYELVELKSYNRKMELNSTTILAYN